MLCSPFCVVDIVHFDIKADNILLDPVDEHISDYDFYGPPAGPDSLPFSICLADFGESEIFGSDRDMYSGRNRGTDGSSRPK